MKTPNDYPPHKGYSPFPTTLPPYVGAVVFETFLYGLYTILMGICVYVLLRRKKPLHWLLLVSALTMYSIATADIGYTYYLLFAKLLKDGISFTDLRPKYWLYVTNNVIADTLLLYRCYVVWHSTKRIIVGPAILLIAGTVCGYLLEGSSNELFAKAWIYLVMTFLLNLILTGLAAGRIWWLARQAKEILGPGLVDRYNATIAILIESGFIYSLYIVLDLALHRNRDALIILDAGLIQVVGIVPTLIIVQVGLGRAVHDVENGGLARHEASGVSSKIQIQSPTRSTLNRSYPDGIGSGLGIHRTHSRQYSQTHGYGCQCQCQCSAEDQTELQGLGLPRRSSASACQCAPCSASSETFIMHPHHLHTHNQFRIHHNHGQSDVERHLHGDEHDHDMDTELGSPNSDMEDLPDHSLALSKTGLVCAELSEILEREHRESQGGA